MDKTKRSLRLTGTVVAIGASSVAAVVAYRAFETRQTEQRWAMLATYCTECHNDEEFAGNVVFEGLTPDAVPAHAETFEAAVRKLRGRLMPPPGNPQPHQVEIDALVTFLERSIDNQSDAPKAAHVPIQRLNRSEYAIAVKDLLGIDIDAEEHLPTEIEVDRFTNIAAALSTSPAFLEQYISVARTVAHLAVGTPNPKLASAYFPPPADDQDGYVDGLPLGTRGGTRFEHNFPADGEYHINITDLDVGLYPRSLETEHTLVILVDRTEVFRARLGGAADLELVDRGGAPGRAELMARFTEIPVRVAAGVHEVVVTFIERSRASTDEPIFGFTPYGGFSFRGQMRVPRVIGGIEVEGPFGATGLSRTASRDKIFVCQPESPVEERACAQRITATLARRAFRRPVDQNDIDRLMTFYEGARQNAAGFDAGIERMITALLASPDFLYRGLVGGRPAEETEIHELSDLDLASRLSFFLWSQGPDDELLELASAGQLRDTDVLRAQAKRMLADPRAEALVTGFALAWLNVDDLDAVDPDDRLFPEFSDELRADFETEIGLFLSSVLLGDENVQHLLTGDYTFLNERLAKHYGIAGVRGPQFRRVTLDDERRYGLLGKAAVLLRTSYGDRTSPILRGAWVLEKLMGTPPTPPPAGVETDLSTPAGEQPKTIRIRLEQHRMAPNCNACHGVIDPYGLALENFTVTGQWRDYDREADAPIDAKTSLPSGVVVADPVELREALLRRDDQFVQALTQKLMMYALGRELEYHDMPQVRAVVRAAARDDYRMSAIVAGIVSSEAFRLQAPPHDDASGEQLASLRSTPR
jgi:mono/diheme cytochrome c family protein